MTTITAQAFFNPESYMYHKYKPSCSHYKTWSDQENIKHCPECGTLLELKHLIGELATLREEYFTKSRWGYVRGCFLHDVFLNESSSIDLSFHQTISLNSVFRSLQECAEALITTLNDDAISLVVYVMRTDKPFLLYGYAYSMKDDEVIVKETSWWMHSNEMNGNPMFQEIKPK